MPAVFSAIKRVLGHQRPAVTHKPARDARRARKLAERARKRAERQRVKEEQRDRTRFFATAAAMTPYVAVEIGDEIIFTSTRDEGVGEQVFVSRWRKDMTVLERAVGWMADNGIGLPPEPHLVDVGANIGTTTVMALRRHGFDRSVAIEPSPENARVLHLNVASNGLDARVKMLQVAAGDEEGHLRLDVSCANMGGHRVVDAAGAGETLVVESVTLDGLVSRGVIEPERVGLVWIDVQGHEAAVLAGGSSLIEAGIPIVVAIRQVQGDPEVPRPWAAAPGTRAAVLASLRAGYTDIVELRKHSKRGRATHPIDELDMLVDSFRHCQDLLLVRRG